MTARRAAVTAVTLAAVVTAGTGGAAPASASLLPLAYGTYSMASIAPRPCGSTRTNLDCTVSVTAKAGVHLDGSGHCSEVGTIPGYAGLGCSVTLSVSATVDSSCSSVSDVSAEVTVSSGTGTSFNPVVTAVALKGGTVSFTANQVDASPTVRGFHIAGTVNGVCALPEPGPYRGQAWSFSGYFIYAD